jgi:NADH:ubiquinone oxidoreductase subunit 6 (subunit J)
MLLNSLSFLFIAIILNLSFNETIHRITYKYILAIFILSVLIGLAKLVYVPILFLFGLIPSWKFKSTKVWIGIFAIVISAGFGTAYFQKMDIDSKYIPYNQYNEIYRDQTMLKKGVDINKQIAFVKENPKYIIKIIVKSFFREFSSMTNSYIGLLGWSDINLPTWYIYVVYLIIFFIILINFQENRIKDLTLIKRIYIGLIAGSLLILIMLSQYLSWDIVGEDSIYPLQGRYFIPIFPLFFIMLFNVVKINISYKVQKNIEMGILIFCIFSGILSVYLLASKYTLYNYSHAKWKFNYTFKEMENDTTDKNSIDYIRSNGNVVAAFNKPEKKFISNERYFTGYNALKLSKNNPYGFTLKIFKGMANDKIIVSCRTYGYDGFIVVQEIPNGIYYLSEKNYSEKDSLGWKYNEAQFILPHNVTDGSELRIYEWYPGNDSIYVDDFRLTYFDKTSGK